MSISVKNLTLSIGGTSSENFDISLEGGLWHMEDFTLHQALLRPNSLSFSMHKDPEEDASEPRFSLCGWLIGKEVVISLQTDNIEEASALSQGAGVTADIEFKGIITDTSGTRETAGQYNIQVNATGYEGLLRDNPTCKSWEQATLAQIVEDIIEPYATHLQTNIDPRLTEPIPYTVQYNEDNYSLLTRLAQRYGEWFYSDGTQLVFGKLIEQDSVRLKYPSNDVPDYSVQLRMMHTAFNHLAASYNADDSSQKDGESEMMRPYNELADLVFNASREHFVKQTLQNLHSGGFSDTDAREQLLNTSTKTQARGEKANMLNYTGTTYCSKIKLGGKLVIEDNYLAGMSTDTLSQVDQDEILVVSLTHRFSADMRYTNQFIGIPAACDFPPYSNADTFPLGTPSRAKVTDNEDPANLGRVRVQFHWQAQQDPDMMTPWLRIVQPYAGGGKGFSFIPEIGEEVMVDFEGANAERPFVKGTLYNAVSDPDSAWLPGNNQVKAIRTRNGHTIEIWDQGEGGYIRIYDNEKENYILTFSTDEQLIKLESTGNIELYAKNDIIIEAGHDIKTTAGNDSIHHADNNVKVTAGNDMQLSASHDQTRSADNDIREHAGHDRSASIDRNDTLNVSENQHTEVGDSQNVKVKSKLQVQATDIRVEAQSKIEAQAAQINEKASSTMALNANASIDIKAGIVKVN